MAFIGGIMGAIFNHLNVKINHWRAHNIKTVKSRRVLEAMFVAWLTATIFFWAPAAFDSGCKNDLESNVVVTIFFLLLISIFA